MKMSPLVRKLVGPALLVVALGATGSAQIATPASAAPGPRLTSHANSADNPACVPGASGYELCHGWTVAGTGQETLDTTKIADWHCTYNVPDVPKNMNGVTHYLYCNYANDTSTGNAQSQFVPQLMIGNTMGCADQPNNVGDHWYIQAQYYYGQVGQQNGSCQGGKAFPVQPGDTVTSDITYDPWGAYELSISDVTSGATSTVTIDHPWMDPSKAWKDYPMQYVAAAFESWGATDADQYPADSWKVTSEFYNDGPYPLSPQTGASTLEQTSCTSSSASSTCTWGVPQ